MGLKIKTLFAKPVSYNSKSKRSYDSIKYIVIHYTGNKGDTAENNAKYFANSNNRAAGAHFFVDKKGKVYKSIAINRTAWSVGGKKYSNCAATGGGTYYGKCTNANSISIELCDCLEDTNDAQTRACKELIEYIQKICPNAVKIIRHFDVTGKSCPGCMSGKNNEKWKKFYSYIK